MGSSGFNPVLTQVPGFRAVSTGALSSNWTLANNTQSTRDIEVVLDNVNICKEPTTSLASPCAWWESDVVDYQLYGSLRVSTSAGANAAIFASPLPYVTNNSGVGLTHWLNITLGTGVRTISQQNAAAVDFTQTITANRWYRVMLEKFGPNIQFWFNPTGDADPRNLTDSGLQLLRSTQTPDYTVVWVAMTASPTALSASDYCGICDLVLIKLEPWSTSDPTLGAHFTAPIPSPYTYYKSVRQMSNMLNKLVLPG